MPTTPQRLRRLRQRRRASTHELEEVFYFYQDLLEYAKADLEEAKKHDEEIEKKAKEKKAESFFLKRFTFGTLLVWTMILGPLFDGLVALMIWKALF